MALNKIGILFGMRKGRWEWMLSRQLTVSMTINHLLDFQLHENRGYIFSYYCTPNM